MKQNTERPDYSLLLNNLYTALYAKENNPYTEYGNVFGFSKKITGDSLKNLLDENLRESSSTPKNLMSEIPFIPYKKYFQNSIDRYAISQNEAISSPNQEVFLLAHLGGWRPLGYNLFSFKNPVMHDNGRSPETMQGMFRADLATWIFAEEKMEQGGVSCIFDKTENSMPGTTGPSGDSKCISEYIISCNYSLVSQKCFDKDELRKILGHFTENMLKAEEIRKKEGKKSLSANNQDSLEYLRDCLARMLGCYDQTKSEEQKDWFLARVLGWLIIAAMLREQISLPLLRNYITYYTPNIGDEHLTADEANSGIGSINAPRTEILKLNILIPLEYNREDYEKIENSNEAKNKGGADRKFSQNMESVDLSSKEWFCKCFRNKPIEANYQNVNSPLLTNRNYRIKRVELQSPLRARIGINQKEDISYRLLKFDDISFQIKKIRILFTKSSLAFLHIEIVAKDMSGKDVLKFINAFSNINSSNPKIIYKRRIAKDAEKVLEISLKDIILNTIGLQNYIALSVYEGKISPYFQICLIGACNQNEKLQFFDSIRSLSKRDSAKPIDDRLYYTGNKPYIFRFAGDRTLNIIGDTHTCGSDNLPFLTDYGNGLIKSATENYMTAYAFLISLRLLSGKSNLGDDDLDYLLEAPLDHLSDEDNIREFIDKCLLKNGWCLEKTISIRRENIRREYERRSLADLRATVYRPSD